MKFKRSELLLAGVYVLVLVIAGITVLFRYLFVAEFQQLRENVELLQQTQQKMAAIIRQSDVIERLYADVVPAELPALPDADSMLTEVLQDIRRRVAAADMAVIALKPFATESMDAATLFRVQVETEGTLSALGAFLFDLDSSIFNVSVGSAQVMAQGLQEPLRMQLMVSAAVLDAP